MSASRHEPEALQVLDLGTAAEIFVDGIAAQVEVNGVIRMVFFTIQPDETGGGAPRRIVNLRLNCPAEAFLQIGRQQAASPSPSRHPAH